MDKAGRRSPAPLVVAMLLDRSSHASRGEDVVLLLKRAVASASAQSLFLFLSFRFSLGALQQKNDPLARAIWELGLTREQRRPE
ncbi:hypothetical protein VTK73DRAFT_7870 [Phialemonium thermophilum]|uniref:Uncharacterized protein n=1 Tax=Phialemonium thermophilum TaxID=223376 RepID=A0ABR3WC32_9PEZI